MKLKATSLAATLILGLIPAVCHAQDFSADVMYVATHKPDAPTAGTGTSTHPSSKLYVSKDQMRLETRGLAETVLLVNGAEHTADALFPARKAYQPLATVPSEYFGVQDVENACPDWQKTADQKIACEKVGHEVVDGRRAIKYQNKGASDDATAAVWIDLTLKFVSKWQNASTGAELRNIKEEQQAADLFAVPAAYKLLQPQKAKSKGFSQKSR